MPPTGMTIRPLRKKDCGVFLSMIDALAAFERLKPPTRAARSRLINDALGSRRRFDAYLAFVDARAVGYAIIFETYSSFLARPTLFLEDIFVLPGYRNQKIGLRLFRWCVAEARRRRCGRMEWMVLHWNTKAIRFYNRLGAHRMDDWLPYRLTSGHFNELLKSLPRGVPD